MTISAPIYGQHITSQSCFCEGIFVPPFLCGFLYTCSHLTSLVFRKSGQSIPIIPDVVSPN